MTIRIVIVDDHHVVRKGLFYFFQTQKDLEIVGEATNGKEALDLLTNQPADVVLLDVQMPEMDGIEATKKIKERFPETRVLILTSFSDYHSVIPAIQAGASGYQLKDAEPEELARAIRNVYDGKKMIDEKAAVHLFQHISPDHLDEDKKRLHELTKREMEVLQELMKGKSNKEIARDLFITEKTVKTHVSNILSKLEVHDRTQAALLAVKHLDSK
ncbi:LuxR family two component transcriptional regulator [Melghiribacillus thermohalophilus]|uniref:LuxR family two component transcriptional regulator n=1 Tax=Melghiribacillus thermohalophilus TaxID=1324956 RepID=A0A4R3MR85_9BACI|nr:response regulator transcription factor [Melghiribacillus thermohalophilus]TCT18000.1 LuxR family two component transcriptional regulator [Melghiribacillus thermohalophilus]